MRHSRGDCVSDAASMEMHTVARASVKECTDEWAPFTMIYGLPELAELQLACLSWPMSKFAYVIDLTWDSRCLCGIEGMIMDNGDHMQTIPGISHSLISDLGDKTQAWIK
eukprot:1543292-Amphidinium_carterae.1